MLSIKEHKVHSMESKTIIYKNKRHEKYRQKKATKGAIVYIEHKINNI